MDPGPVVTTCPTCQRHWDDHCEQAVCVEKHGACMICTFGTPESRPANGRERARINGQLAEVEAESRRRRGS